MFDIVLVHPQIAPNTGNIMRLSANTGACLHLVRPLGFTMSDRQLRRAGLDYSDRATVRIHNGWADVEAALGGRRLFAVDTGGAITYSDVGFAPGDVFVFGSEPDGLSDNLMRRFPADRQLRLPMVPGSRSLNLSNAVAVVLYDAWRQVSFTGAG